MEAYELTPELRRCLAQAVVVSWAIRTALANNRRILLRTIADPANVQDLANARELLARLNRNRRRSPASITACLDHVDRIRWIDVLGLEGRREVDTCAQNVRVSGSILATN